MIRVFPTSKISTFSILKCKSQHYVKPRLMILFKKHSGTNIHKTSSTLKVVTLRGHALSRYDATNTQNRLQLPIKKWSFMALHTMIPFFPH